VRLTGLWLSSFAVALVLMSVAGVMESADHVVYHAQAQTRVSGS
jgi:hypothetical protein